MIKFLYIISVAAFMVFAVLGIVEFIDGSIHKAIFNVVIAAMANMNALYLIRDR